MSENKTKPPTDKFFKEHDELPSGIYKVDIYDKKNRFVMTALFSTIEKAQVWLKTLPDEGSCVTAPFVIDEPDFGNIKGN